MSQVTWSFAQSRMSTHRLICRHKMWTRLSLNSMRTDCDQLLSLYFSVGLEEPNLRGSADVPLRLLSDAFVWHLSVWRLSVCLSVAYIGPNSRTERPRKTKIGTGVDHVTRTPLSRSKGQRSTSLMGKKDIACAHILLCFALLWQCRHELGKIAQCLFFSCCCLF